jgi:uncharacterized protein
MNAYLQPLLGGVLIGLGSLLALAVTGKVPGISGIVARLIRPTTGDVAWRFLFLVGLVAGAGVLLASGVGWVDFTLPHGRGMLVVAIAGLLVGFGTRMGGGCTSGHGVCGMGSLAKDSIVYTIVFMAAAAVTVFVWNLINGGGAQ